MNADTLKPCPFCGGDADFQYHNGGWPDACYSVRCKDWKCPGKTSSGSQAVAAEAWNTRAADNIALQAEVERLREAIAPFLRGTIPDDVHDDATLSLRWPNYETRGVTVLAGAFWYAHELRALRRAALNETPDTAAVLPG